MGTIMVYQAFLLIFTISYALGMGSSSSGYNNQYNPGLRLRRQYPNNNYNRRYQSQNFGHSSMLPKPRASSRGLASILAEEPEEYYYCPPNNPKKNKRMGVKIFQEVVGDKITKNMDKYFNPIYIQHNPSIADGIEALREALSPGGIFFGPPEKIDFVHVGADGDLVWLHQRRVRPNGDVFAHLDLLRFECGKIIEHWDVIQSTDLAEPAANEHPFF